MRRPVSGDAGRGSLGPAGTKLRKNTQTFCLNGGLILGRVLRARRRRITEGRPIHKDRPRYLLRFPPLLLAQSLPRKRFLGPALLAGLHIETMFLDLLDDIFLLHLALKTPQGIFQRFILLDDDFCHFINSPPIRFGLVTCGASRRLCRGRHVDLRAPPLSLLSHVLAVSQNAPERSLGSSKSIPALQSRNLCRFLPVL